MVLLGEEELRIAVSTELTLAGGGGGGCDDGVLEVRLAGEPSDMVGKVDGGNMVLYCC